ncbi:MAG: hypothetical protein ABI548_17720 [Polyangiaceae bacterium]
MRSILLSVCVISAVSMAFSACSDDGTVTSGGDAGAAGASPMGAAGAPDAAGAAGAAGARCGSAGTGTLQVVVSGLPSDVDAAVTVSGLMASPHLVYDSIDAGEYTVTAKRVYDADPTVRTAYDPTIDEPTLCLTDGDDHTVHVTYQAIPTSNKLWSLNDNGSAGVVGFGSAKLGATATTAASVVADAPAGQSLAFDFNGNLWTGPATVGDPVLARYPAAALAASGMPTADLAFNVPAIGCVPALKGIALDATGNVWLSTCDQQLLQIPSTAFATPTGSDFAQDVAPSVTLSGVTANEDIAFDSAGNLWVADDGKVERFDKARLASDDTAAPDLTLSVTTDDTTPKDLTANFLAFDAHGNLWALDFDGNGVFELLKTSLSGSGAHTIATSTHLVLGVLALLARPAFDDGGSLWLPLSTGKFGKLPPALLGISTDAGSPTTPAVVVSSSDVGSADGFAFFPAAVGLPLPSAQP